MLFYHCYGFFCPRQIRQGTHRSNHLAEGEEEQQRNIFRIHSSDHASDESPEDLLKCEHSFQQSQQVVKSAQLRVKKKHG
ncbi:MAG: hypothetical protein NBKEAIPA_03126 [Nitrospirae bacterium]|nr:hypothetical protein [Nitrospirota bacterium]